MAITYFFSAFVSVYWVVFVVIVNYIFFVLRKNKLGSHQKYDDELFGATFTLSILVIFILNFVNLPYYQADFDIPKRSLYVAQGQVITDLIGNTSSDEVLIKMQENKSMTFNLNYLNNKLMNREVVVPVGEHITVLYHNLYDGFYIDSDILIPYEIRSNKYTYLHYEQSLHFLKHVKIKSMLFLVISLVLYMIANYLAVRFVIKMSKKTISKNIV